MLPPLLSAFRSDALLSIPGLVVIIILRKSAKLSFSNIYHKELHNLIRVDLIINSLLRYFVFVIIFLHKHEIEEELEKRTLYIATMR